MYCVILKNVKSRVKFAAVLNSIIWFLFLMYPFYCTWLLCFYFILWGSNVHSNIQFTLGLNNCFDKIEPPRLEIQKRILGHLYKIRFSVFIWKILQYMCIIKRKIQCWGWLRWKKCKKVHPRKTFAHGM